MGDSRELLREREYVENAQRRLDELLRTATGRMREALALKVEAVTDLAPGPQHGARYERDVLVYAAETRIGALQTGDYPLCFGRIDRDDGARWYLGRAGVPGPDHEPLVVDWRAPVAEAFYRATGRHPMGLRLRRHFAFENGRLSAFEDERFEGGEDLGLAGPGALVASLERSRTGKMHDIVATVQREQDEIIRSDFEGILVVQGGPGTGKTAVALHRAAYLLFTHRARLGRRGILVVGPNPVFLGYIDQVLPALGESGAMLATPAGVVGLDVRGTDTREAARIKGDPRMVGVIARAVGDRERPIPRDITVAYDDIELGSLELKLRAADTAELVASVRRRRGTHNDKRPLVERGLLALLYRAYTSVAARGLVRPRGIRAQDLQAPEAEVSKRLWLERPVRSLVDRMWPVLTPEELLHDLFGSLPLLRSAGLTGDEAAVIFREWSSVDDVAWTDADAALLDEAFVHLGPVEARKIADPDEPPEVLLPLFGHIVVDEAQDLSAMQHRVLARRSVSGSMTLVGDVGQAGGAWAPHSWEEVVEQLGAARRGHRVAELTVSYRTPAEVMRMAARVLRAAAPELRPPRTVRTAGSAPVVRRLTEGELARTAASHSRSGSVAVVCADSHAGALGAELEGAGIEFAHARSRLTERVTLAPVSLVKGLEFDCVVVVEPERISREFGLRMLYVALTRPTKRLVVLHAEPLPATMRRARHRRA